MAGDRSKIIASVSFLVVVCLSYSRTVANAQADFTVLTLMWPGAYCRGESDSGCCCPTTGMPKLEFYIQGLQTYSSTQKKLITLCSNNCKFYVNRLRNIITDMYNYWPNVTCPSNNGKELWESNWCYYGTCTNLAQLDYFNNSLVLRAKYEPLKLLSENGNPPTMNHRYSLKEIYNKLTPTLGSAFFVECDSKSRSNLYKVHLCATLDATRLMRCPIKFTSNCREYITFPPYTDNMLKGAISRVTDVSMEDIELVLSV